MQSNRHEIIINSKDINKAFQQIVLWGETRWWPKNCTMKFRRMETTPIQKGTMYSQKVMLPFAPSWCAVVTDVIDNRSISRRFIDGFLDSQETVSVQTKGDKIKIEYSMDYEVKGRVNKVLWIILFRNLHDRNIRLILENLRKYLENTQMSTDYNTR